MHGVIRCPTPALVGSKPKGNNGQGVVEGAGQKFDGSRLERFETNFKSDTTQTRRITCRLVAVERAVDNGHREVEVGRQNGAAAAGRRIEAEVRCSNQHVDQPAVAASRPLNPGLFDCEWNCF